MVRPVLVVLAVLCASSASAQPPPWAGHPADPPPAFLVVSAPASVEPASWSPLRQEWQAARRAWRSRLDQLASHDEHLELTLASPSDEELERVAHVLVDPYAYPDGLDAHVLLARVADPALVSQTEPVVRRLLSIVRRMLDEDGFSGAAVDVATDIASRWPCSTDAIAARSMARLRCVSGRTSDMMYCIGACYDWYWGGPSASEALACPAPGPREDVCAGALHDALGYHGVGQHLRSHSVEERDPVAYANALASYALAAEGYAFVLEHCAGIETLEASEQTVVYDLADALFWSERYDDASAAYESVRDWSWERGPSDGYESYAAVRAADCRRRIVDTAIVEHALALPAPTPSPVEPPPVIRAAITAREVYLSRFPDDPEHVRVSFLLANAALLERYGYWDEARTRYAAVLDAAAHAAAAHTDDDARLAAAGIVRMAMALGDAAEVARIAALAPASP